MTFYSPFPVILSEKLSLYKFGLVRALLGLSASRPAECSSPLDEFRFALLLPKSAAELKLLL